jgi:hypothetical protein
MNSQQKFMENETELATMQQKINQEIKTYTLRKLVAADELANCHRSRQQNSEDYALYNHYTELIAKHVEEIEFCSKQIKAYSTKDFKAMATPLRNL